MPEFELTSDEQDFVSDLICSHAGTNSYGFGVEGLLEQRLDRLLDNQPSRMNPDDLAQFEWMTARRVIVLRLVTAGCLAPRVAAAAMAFVWCVENSPQKVISSEVWLGAFNRLGYTSDPADEIARPDAPARVWRGSTPENWAGLAWTEDRKVAERFAAEQQQVGLNSVVFTVVVDPQRVRARYNKDDEQEWVIDPRGLDVSQA